MERDVADFHQRHPELCLLGTVGTPRITTVYNFIAPDGVRLGVSIDFGRWKHMSFSKRGGQASEEEIKRYLDFFSDTPWLKTLSPLGTGIVHFYEVGYPHPELLKGGN